jgi:hypothetical protein
MKRNVRRCFQMGNLIVECPGCKLKLPSKNLEPCDRYHASGECWQLYGELAAYNMSKNDPAFIHQLAVDAYGAQHSGGVTRNITTAFALIGLYLSIECGYTGRQVQKAHMELAKRRHDWPRFEPPHQTYSLTVFDVLRVEPGKKRDEMLKAWAEDVWKSWEHYHDWVRTICHQWLNR